MIKEYFTFKHGKEHPIHNWFYYKEAYAPELVEHYLSLFKPNIVYDPFCGIGTTPLVCKSKGISCIAVDSSPLSIFVSSVKTSDYSAEETKSIYENMKNISPAKEKSDWSWDFELFHPSKVFGKRNYNQLISLRTSIENIQEEKIKAFFLFALVSILPQSGFFRKDGGVLRPDPKKSTIPPKIAFKRKIKQMLKDLKENSIKGPVPELLVADARSYKTKADAFITSPPYLNNIDYSKVYGLELSLLAMEKDITKLVRSASIRSFITGSSFSECPEEAKEYSHIPIASTYFADMEKVLHNLYLSTEKGAMIVGNAVIHETHIPVDEILIAIGERIGFKGKIDACKIRTADVRPKKLEARESSILFWK
ncbi:hypothetical protein KAW38_04895 [Candidatus Micrarchaeota archaeon]|nr:hypothetical protein [Candidatus Micrarchaeota archaeon]